MKLLCRERVGVGVCIRLSASHWPQLEWQVDWPIPTSQTGSIKPVAFLNPRIHGDRPFFPMDSKMVD